MLFQKIFLFGIDNAGKTCLSEAMRTGKAPDNLFPTTCFDVKALFIKHFEDSVEFRVWDAPGQTKYRNVWGEGFKVSNLMMFVLDMTDIDRFQEAREAFEKVIKDPETQGVPLIFCFHKMEGEDARKNLPEARATFKLGDIVGRHVIQLETSIKDPESIDKIKEAVAEIVVQARKFAPGMHGP